MVTRKTSEPPARRPTSRQRWLFAPELPPPAKVNGPDVACAIAPIEKRRDGGTRYWCSAHRADATAKGGTPAKKCRAADMVPISTDETLLLDLNKYRGGVALWGAVPAVYDTTRQPMDRGIHVHTRLTPECAKDTDWTYRAVRLIARGL